MSRLRLALDTVLGVLDLPLLRLGALRMSLPVLDRRRRGTRFIAHDVRTIANSPESTGIGVWSVNPYIGCEFGCSYCYARFAHRYVVERARDQGRIDAAEFSDLRGSRGFEAFERSIFVKRRAAVVEALERDLARIARRARKDPQTLLIGTATDPYQPAERRFGVTRAVLERLRRERGLHIGIITKSALIARDRQLLRQLQERHQLSVHISLISTDVALVRAFEARSPMPRVRMRALRRLVASDINAGLIVAPVLPGITDGIEALHALLDAARTAGARFAHPSVLRLYPAVRAPFLPVLERSFPNLVPRYLHAYRNAIDAPRAYRDALGRRFRAVAEEVGIPVDRDVNEPALPHYAPEEEQLGLWGNAIP